MSNGSMWTIVFLVTALALPASQDRPLPVPPIQTALGQLPGVADLPSRVELPEVLVFDDGREVKTPAEWARRREEMKRTLAYYAVGVMPPPPGNVTGRSITSRRLADGAVSYRLVHLAFGPGRTLGFDVAVFTPGRGAGPYPTVIFPSFGLTPGAAPLPTMPRPAAQGKGLDALSLPLGVPTGRAGSDAPSNSDAVRPGQTPPAKVDPEGFAAEHADLFRRGYALVTYHYQDTGEDTIARNADGSWAFRNSRFFPAYPGCDWGLLGGWAWGVSRVVDYLQGESFADRARLVAVGHSRIGKAVLVAGAFDERIALVAPAGSGAGGTGAYRFNGAAHGGREGLDDMMRKYPNWFSPHLRQFAGRADRLPFDQHWLIALVAPRAFVSLEGSDDQNCLPDALRRARDAALPAYALARAAGRLGVHYAPHRHILAAEDWAALLDFADLQLRGMAVSRRFDGFPPGL